MRVLVDLALTFHCLQGRSITIDKISEAGRYVWVKTENDGGEDFVGGEGGIGMTQEEERRMRGRGRRRGWMTKERGSIYWCPLT